MTSMWPQLNPDTFSEMRQNIVNPWICLYGHQIYQRCTSKWWITMHRFSGLVSQDLIAHISMRIPHIFIWTVKLVFGSRKKTRNRAFYVKLRISAILEFIRWAHIKKMLKYATNCDDLQWDGKLIAILMHNRFIGYQATSKYGLGTSDCLCYRFFPSISDILSNHKKIVEHSLFCFLRNVGEHFHYKWPIIIGPIEVKSYHL